MYDHAAERNIAILFLQMDLSVQPDCIDNECARLGLGLNVFVTFFSEDCLKLQPSEINTSLKSDLVNIRVHELNISKIDPFLKLTQLILFIASNVICFRDSRIKSIYFVNTFDYNRYPFISCIVVCIGIYANTTSPLFASSCINNTYILKWHEVSKSFYNIDRTLRAP